MCFKNSNKDRIILEKINVTYINLSEDVFLKHLINLIATQVFFYYTSKRFFRSYTPPLRIR